MKKQILFAAAAVASLLLAAPADAAWNSSNIGWTGTNLGGAGGNSSGWASTSSGNSSTTSSSTSSGASSSTSTGGATSSSSGGATQVPEPSNLLMLALGFAGLIGGRFAARRKRRVA